MRKSRAFIPIEWRWLVFCAAFGLGVHAGFSIWRFCEAWPVVAILLFLILLSGFAFSFRIIGVFAAMAIGLLVAMREASSRKAILDEAHGWNAHSPIALTMRVGEDAKIFVTPKGDRKMAFDATARGIKLKVTSRFEDGMALPRAGEIWLCRGWLAGWADDDIFARRKFWVRGEGCGMKKISPGFSGVYRFLNCVKSQAARRLAIGVDENSQTLEYSRAILLGEKSSISRKSLEVFIASGAVHIFAISGLHVMVVARIFQFLASCILPMARARGVAVTLLVWLYVLMTGAGISAIRAGAMASFCLLAPVFQRRPDAIVSWALAFVVCHLIKPEMLLDVGGVLSFSVMLALVLFSRIAQVCNFGKVFSSIGISFVAWAAGTPIIAMFFGRFTAAGILSGLIAIPLSCAVVVFGFGAIMMSLVSEKLASYANNIAILILDCIGGLCEIIARIPLGDMEIRNWSMFEAAGWYSALGLGALAIFMLRREAKL